VLFIVKGIVVNVNCLHLSFHVKPHLLRHHKMRSWQ